MAKLSREALEMLSEFITGSIKAKGLDGITYVLLTKDAKSPKNQEDLIKFKKIKSTVEACGFGKDEAFRMYELPNGYIFDMDLSIVKQITIKIAEKVAQANGGKTPQGDLIANHPEERRRADMENLAKYLMGEFKKGRRCVEVALFSRNESPRIVFTANDSKGGQAVVRYNAYAIRHWDIEDINERLLIPKGIRVSRIEPCEILPTKTGVRFKLYLSKIA